MFNTYLKQFEQAANQVTDLLAPKQFKEAQDKSKTFALDILTAATEATHSNIEAVAKLAGKDAKEYFTKASDLVDTTYQYAKEIIETGTIKSFALPGYTK
jgi:LPS O-antigen subunit length determinant protein (WzzB/FepE family)